MKTTLLFFAFVCSALMQAQTYTFNTSTPIPDGAQIGTGTCGTGATPGSVTTTLDVPLAGTVADPTKITINLNLAHTWMGDVVAELVTPGGANCALIKRVGAGSDTACGSSGDFVTGNVLSFNSANTTTLPISGNPATGNYAPTGPTGTTYPATIPLCDLTAFLNGVAVNGTWSMKFYDNGFQDLGTVNSWSLVFAPGALPTQEFIYNTSFSVLGNPFENELVLGVNDPTAKIAKLSLYAIDGKLVHVTTLTTIDVNENVRIDTSSLSQGVYVLVPEIDGRKQNAIKVVKR